LGQAEKRRTDRMTLFELLFLIFYIGFGAGVPLIWYAKQVSNNRKEQVDERMRFRVHSDKTFEEAHRDAVRKVHRHDKK